MSATQTTAYTFSAAAVAKLLEYATDRSLDLCNADATDLRQDAVLSAFLTTQKGDAVVVEELDVRLAMRDLLVRRSAR